MNSCDILNPKWRVRGTGELKHSASLTHYGIKGMRWGVRRTPEQLGHRLSKTSNTAWRNTSSSGGGGGSSEEEHPQIIVDGKIMQWNYKLNKYVVVGSIEGNMKWTMKGRLNEVGKAIAKGAKAVANFFKRIKDGVVSGINKLIEKGKAYAEREFMSAVEKNVEKMINDPKYREMAEKALENPKYRKMVEEAMKDPRYRDLAEKYADKYR